LLVRRSRAQASMACAFDTSEPSAVTAPCAAHGKPPFFDFLRRGGEYIEAAVSEQLPVPTVRKTKGIIKMESWRGSLAPPP